MKLPAKNIITFILFAIAIFNIAYTVIQNWSHLSTPFDPEKYEALYNKSQYVIARSKHVIGDSTLLSHAGYQYAKGLNPILINADHPPLGKYIIGFFTVAFNNNHVVSIIFAFANLLLLCFIIYQASRSLYATSIGAFVFSTDTILKEQIIDSPLMDIVQVFFLLLFFLVFIRYVVTQRFVYVILAGFAAGCMSSTKLYFPAIMLIGISILFFFLYSKKLKDTVINLVTLFALAVTTYTLSYTVYFQKGNNLRDFLGTQKWIFLFWKNNSINNPELYGNIYPLILMNRWRVWWGDQKYISYENWSVLWPIFFFIGVALSIYFVYKYIRSVVVEHKKIKTRENTANITTSLLSMWVLTYLGYFSLIPVYPRYFMMIFFPIYIIVTLFVYKRFMIK